MEAHVIHEFLWDIRHILSTVSADHKVVFHQPLGLTVHPNRSFPISPRKTVDKTLHSKHEYVYVEYDGPSYPLLFSHPIDIDGATIRRMEYSTQKTTRWILPMNVFIRNIPVVVDTHLEEGGDCDSLMDSTISLHTVSSQFSDASDQSAVYTSWKFDKNACDVYDITDLNSHTHCELYVPSLENWFEHRCEYGLCELDPLPIYNAHGNYVGTVNVWRDTEGQVPDMYKAEEFGIVLNPTSHEFLYEFHIHNNGAVFTGLSAGVYRQYIYDSVMDTFLYTGVISKLS